MCAYAGCERVASVPPVPLQGRPNRGREEALANGKAKKGRGRKGGGTSGSRPGTRRRGGDPTAALAEAGPPIGGAVLRIDTWPTDGAPSYVRL